MMYKLPFKVIASPTLGQTFSSIHQLPYQVDATDAQVQLTINSANRNLYLKTPTCSVPELEGPLDFSLYFNSRHSSEPQWQLSCLSAVVGINRDKSKIAIQAQDGAIIEYHYQAASKRFYALAPSDYSGCYLELDEKENRVIWHQPDGQHSRTYDLARGVLLSECSALGHKRQYIYSEPDNRLQKIICSSGHQYQFNWLSPFDLIIKLAADSKPQSDKPYKDKVLAQYRFASAGMHELQQAKLINPDDESDSADCSFDVRHDGESHIVDADGRHIRFNLSKGLLMRISDGDSRHFQLDDLNHIASDAKQTVNLIQVDDDGTFITRIAKLSHQSDGLFAERCYLNKTTHYRMVENEQGLIVYQHRSDDGSGCQTTFNHQHQLESHIELNADGAVLSFTDYQYYQTPPLEGLLKSKHKHLLPRGTTLPIDRARSPQLTIDYIYQERDGLPPLLQYELADDGQLTAYGYDDRGLASKTKYYQKYDGSRAPLTKVIIDQWLSELDSASQQQAHMTYYQRNEQGLVIERHQSDDYAALWQRDLKGQVTQHQLETVSSKVLMLSDIERNALGHITHQRNQLGESINTVYQPLTKQITSSTGLSTTTHYNQAGQVISKAYFDEQGKALGQDNYHYNSRGLLQACSTQSGLRTFQFYNDANQLAIKLESGGKVTCYQYDGSHGVTMIQAIDFPFVATADLNLSLDLAGIDYKRLQQQLKMHIENPAHHSLNIRQTTIKDALQRPLFEIDSAGAVVEYRYDSYGNQTHQIAYATRLNAAQIEQLISEKAFPMTSLSATDDRWQLTLYHHELPFANIDGQGYVTLKNHNGAGLLTKTSQLTIPLPEHIKQQLMIEPSAAKLQQWLTEQGDIKAYHHRQYYDQAGRVTCEVDAEGYLTAFSYNEIGKLKSKRRYATKLSKLSELDALIPPAPPLLLAEDQLIEYHYNDKGLCIIEHHVNDGFQVETHYNQQGKKCAETIKDLTTDTITGDSHRRQTWQYNCFGQLKQQTNPLLEYQIQKIRAQGLDEQEAQQQIASLVAEHADKVIYNEQGLAVTKIDANGHHTELVYDKANRPLLSLSAKGVATLYAYDVHGNLETKRIYQSFNNLEQAELLLQDRVSTFNTVAGLLASHLTDVEPEYYQESYQYDNCGRLSRYTDQDGFVKTIEYNSFGEVQLERQQITKPTETASAVYKVQYYQYDKRGSNIAIIGRAGNGQPINQTRKAYDNPLAKLSFEQVGEEAGYYHHYDGLGRRVLTQVEQRDDKTAELSLVKLEQKAWDAFSRVTRKMAYTKGDESYQTAYQYHRPLRKTIVSKGNNRQVITKNIFDQIIKEQQGDLLAKEYQHNALGLMAEQSVHNHKNHLVQFQAVDYDYVGNKIKTHHMHDGYDILESLQYDEDNHLRQLDTTVVHDDPELSYQQQFIRDVHGKLIEHHQQDGVINQYQRNGRGLVVKTTLDASGERNISVTKYDGLQNRAYHAIKSKAEPTKDKYATAFYSDEQGRPAGKSVDPQGLDLFQQVMRSQAGHIIKQINPQGHARYRINDGRGNPILSISETGIIKRCYYNLQNQVTQIHQYHAQLSSEQMASYLSDEVLAEHNSAALLLMIDGLGSVDDKRVSFTYNEQGQRQQTVHHFYDHNKDQHCGLVHEFSYNATGKKRSHRTYQTVIEVAAVVDNQAQFCPVSLASSLAKLPKNHTLDRQTFYFYDAQDNQRFTISPTGLITENIYNDDNQVIHRIRYHAPLPKGVRQALSEGGKALLPWLLNEGDAASLEVYLNQAGFKANDQNLHQYYFYNHQQKPVYSIDEKQQVTHYKYDAAARRTDTIHFAKAFDVSGQYYDNIELALKQNYQIAEPAKGDRHYQDIYDGLGRLIGQIDPLNQRDGYQRDEGDCIIKHVDRADKCTEHEYDAAKRKVADILPEAAVAEVTLASDNQTLVLTNKTRRVRNALSYDRASNVICRTHDEGGSEQRQVHLKVDAQGRNVGIRQLNVEVDDDVSNATDLTQHRPTKLVTIETFKVLNHADKPLVELDESGKPCFTVYNGLGHVIFEVKAGGIVTGYQRNDFGQVTKRIQYADNIPSSGLEPFMASGIAAAWLAQRVKAFEAQPLNRVTTYQYDDDGHLTQQVKSERYGFNPQTKSFFRASPITVHHYDAFGRLIETLRLVYPEVPDAEQAWSDPHHVIDVDDVLNQTHQAASKAVWHKTYHWYQHGHTTPCLTAETFIDKSDAPTDQFKFTLYQQDVFGNVIFEHQLDALAPLTKTRQEMSLEDVHQLLPEKDAAKDRARSFRYHHNNKLQSAVLHDAVSQHLVKEGTKTVIKDNPAQDLTEEQTTLGARGEMISRTDAMGNTVHAFIDARGHTIAEVGAARMAKGPDGQQQLLYPLTYFYVNAHGERIGSEQYQFGATPESLADCYQWPAVLAPDIARVHSQTLNLVDNRGLLVYQKTDKQALAFAYTAKKQLARQWLSRLSSNEQKLQQRVIDETRYRYGHFIDYIAKELYRDGARLDELSFHRLQNNFGELIQEWNTAQPENKRLINILQGSPWMQVDEKGVPKLLFGSLTGMPTLEIKAHANDIRTLATIEQGILYYVDNIHNTDVLKTVTVPNFDGHILKLEKPTTIGTKPLQQAIAIGIEHSHDESRLLSLPLQSHEVEANSTLLVRVFDEHGRNVTPNQTISGCAQPSTINGRHCLNIDELAKGNYRAELYYFNQDDIVGSEIKAGCEPRYSASYQMQLEDKYQAIDASHHASMMIEPQFKIYQKKDGFIYVSELSFGDAFHQRLAPYLQGSIVELLKDQDWVKFHSEYDSISSIWLDKTNKGMYLPMLAQNNNVPDLEVSFPLLAASFKFGQYFKLKALGQSRNNLYIISYEPFPYMLTFNLEGKINEKSKVINASTSQPIHVSLVKNKAGHYIGFYSKTDRVYAANELLLSTPDKAFTAQVAPTFWPENASQKLTTNRISHTQLDRYNNPIIEVDEDNHQTDLSYYKNNQLRLKMGPMARFLVDDDTGQLSRVSAESASALPAVNKKMRYRLLEARKLTQVAYDSLQQNIGEAAGYLPAGSDSPVFNSASTIERSVTGQKVALTDASGICTLSQPRGLYDEIYAIQTNGMTQAMHVNYVSGNETQFSLSRVGLDPARARVFDMNIKVVRDPLSADLVATYLPWHSANSEGTSLPYDTVSLLYRADPSGNINYACLPLAQSTSYSKDSHDFVLRKSNVYGSVFYNRNPWSSDVTHYWDSAGLDDWYLEYNGLGFQSRRYQAPFSSSYCNAYLHHRLKLKETGNTAAVSTERLQPEDIRLTYTADLLTRVDSRATGTKQVYLYDSRANRNSTMRINSEGHLELVKAQYTPYNTVSVESADGKFVAQNFEDPFGNQVVSILDLIDSSTKRLGKRLRSGASFDAASRIVLNNVEVQPILESGLLTGYNLDATVQGGVRTYTDRGLLATEYIGDHYFKYEYDSLARMSSAQFQHGWWPVTNYLSYSLFGHVEHQVWNHKTAWLPRRNYYYPRNPCGENALVLQNRWDTYLNKNLVAFSRFDELRSAQTLSVGTERDGTTMNAWTVYDMHESFDDPFSQHRYYNSISHRAKSLQLVPIYVASRYERFDGHEHWGPQTYNFPYYLNGKLSGAMMTTTQRAVANSQSVYLTDFSAADEINRLTYYSPTQTNSKSRGTPAYNWRYNVNALLGVSGNYLGYVITSPLSKVVTSGVTKVAYNGWQFCSEHVVTPHMADESYDVYCSYYFNGMADSDVKKRGMEASKTQSLMKAGGVQDNDAVAEYYSKERYRKSVLKADAVNSQSPLDRALVQPKWLPLEKPTKLSDPILKKVMKPYHLILPFLVKLGTDELSSGLILPMTESSAELSSPNETDSFDHIINSMVNIYSVNALPPKEADDEDGFWSVFIDAVVSMVVMIVAPPLGVSLAVGEALASQAVMVGLTSAALSAGAHGLAYQLHLINEFNILDSLAAGLAAGVGVGIGAIGSAAHLTTGNGMELINSLKMAATNNITSQLSRITSGRQQGFNVNSLLMSMGGSFIGGKLSKSMALKADDLLGQAAKGFMMATMMEGVGSAIAGREIHINGVAASALGAMVGEKLGGLLVSKLPHINPAKSQSTIQPKNATSKNKASESKVTSSSQSRYDEDKYHQATQASKGQTPEHYASESMRNTETFMQEFWDDMGVGFNSTTGQLVDNYDELSMHMSGANHDWVQTANHHEFDSTTMRHEQAQNRAARWQSEANKPSSQSRFGLFSSNTLLTEDAMRDAVGFLAQDEQQKLQAGDQFGKSIVKGLFKNFLQNTYQQDIAPTVSFAGEVAENALTVLPIAIGAGYGVGAYSALPTLARTTIAKAVIGATQGVGGSWATGDDRYGIITGGVIGAGLGIFDIASVVAPSVSVVTQAGINAGISNSVSQWISVYRNPDANKFSLTSLGFSMWGGAVAGEFTKDITVPISKAIIESTIQTPFEGVGGHL